MLATSNFILGSTFINSNLVKCNWTQSVVATTERVIQLHRLHIRGYHLISTISGLLIKIQNSA